MKLSVCLTPAPKQQRPAAMAIATAQVLIKTPSDGRASFCLNNGFAWRQAAKATGSDRWGIVVTIRYGLLPTSQVLHYGPFWSACYMKWLQLLPLTQDPLQNGGKWHFIFLRPKSVYKNQLNYLANNVYEFIDYIRILFIYCNMNEQTFLEPSSSSCYKASVIIFRRLAMILASIWQPEAGSEAQMGKGKE